MIDASSVVPQPHTDSKQFKDFTGKRFGLLFILFFAGKIGRLSRWVCQCDCGNRVVRSTARLTAGSKSCGCLRKIKHGASCGGKVSTEYATWSGIRQRCLNPKNDNFHNYGGRGIKMCDRWRDSFSDFLLDMGAKPSPRHSIERIDNNGDYCKENCRWATHPEQCRNKRINRFIEYNGVRYILSDLAKLLGIKRRTLAGRVYRGLSIDEIIKPIDEKQAFCSLGRVRGKNKNAT